MTNLKTHAFLTLALFALPTLAYAQTTPATRSTPATRTSPATRSSPATRTTSSAPATPTAPAIPAILLNTFTGHSGSILCTAVSPNGKIVATGASDKTLRLWDSSTGNNVLLLTLPNAVQAVEFSADGARLVAGAGTEVLLIDPVARKQLATFTAPAAVTQVALSADGKIVQASGAVLQISVSGGKVTETFRNAWATVWNAQTQKELLSLKNAVPRGGFAPDGSTLALMDSRGTINLWNLAANKSTVTLHQNAGRIGAAAFSPDGKTFAAGNYAGGRADNGDDKSLIIWDAASGRQRFSLVGHLKGIYALTFSSDGKKLWASDYNGSQKLWDLTRGTLLSRLEQVQVNGKLQGMPVGYWAVSPDFLFWASGSNREVLWHDIKAFSHPPAQK